jgi:hypothetical protein
MGVVKHEIINTLINVNNKGVFMKKYGFVYIWFDKKHKKYYIGCHWGQESDGYICSSNWMRMAYRRRPYDFKRRILKRTELRDELFLIEESFLKRIKPEEFGKKYYNLQNHWRHWSESSTGRLSVRSKISETKKKYWASSESAVTREKLSKINKERGVRPPSRKGKIPWNKGLTKNTDERVAANAAACRKPKANTQKMGRYKHKKECDELFV